MEVYSIRCFRNKINDDTSLSSILYLYTKNIRMKRISIYLLTLLFTSFTYAQKNIERFDKELFNIIKKENQELRKQFIQKDKNLINALATTLNIKESSTEDQLNKIVKYYENPLLLSLYNDTQNKFAEISEINNELNIAISNVKAIFPTAIVPTFAFHVSGLKENIIYTDGIISLSIDKYMGVDYPLYQGYFFPTQLAEMQSSLIVRDFIKAWLMADYIPINSPDASLLDEIIAEGKLYYVLEKILPNLPKESILSYTEKDYKTCVSHEKEIWNILKKNNLFYSKDRETISYFTEFNPYIETAIIPSNLKQIPHIGSFIGYQIVTAYMRNTNSSISNLLITPSDIILSKSKYKP